MAQINAFLRTCAAAVRNNGLPRATVVMGNEGGDMDSVVGSIYLAFLLDRTAGPAHVPVLNFPRDDLPLRGDIIRLLRSHDIDPALLVHNEDTPDAAAASAPAVCLKADLVVSHPTLAAPQRLVLYDHNKLRALEAHLGPLVSGIVDHHRDEGEHTAASPRVVRTAGSACTLVAEQYREAGQEVPAPLLLHAPIAVDTMNFDPAMKKVTPEDEAAAAFLRTAHAAAGGDATATTPAAVTAEYEVLVAAKFDVSGLTVAQQLRRDFKKFSWQCRGSPMTVGIAAWLETHEQVLQRFDVPALMAAYDEFCAARGLDALGVMYAAQSPERGFERQLLFYVPAASGIPDPALLPQFCEASAAGTGVGFTKVGGGDRLWFYHQADSTVSRKGLTPLLADYFSHL